MSAGGGGSVHPALLPDTTLVDLKVAWPERELEAQRLAAVGLRAMASALRCYALEIRLNAIICERLDLEHLPRACKTHDLMELVIFTGLWGELDDPANGPIARNWYIVVRFNRKHLNSIRYRPEASLPIGEADDLDLALDDIHDGVLAWLSKPR